MIPWTQINDLSKRAGDLKLKRDFVAMLPLQEEIARLLEANGADPKRVAGAFNYLAALNLQLKRYAIAETYARRSVAYYEEHGVNNREALASYVSLLGWILAFQGRIDEAIPHVERSIAEFSIFHSPEDDFLKQRKAELNKLRNRIVDLPFDF